MVETSEGIGVSLLLMGGLRLLTSYPDGGTRLFLLLKRKMGIFVWIKLDTVHLGSISPTFPKMQKRVTVFFGNVGEFDPRSEPI